MYCRVQSCIMYIFLFRHRVQSGVWSSHVLAYYEGQGYTIRDAIHYWYWNVSDTEEGVAFRDVCSGPHCSSTCPEEFILEGEDVAAGWSTGAKITIAVVVLTIAVICLLMKVCSYADLNEGSDMKSQSEIRNHQFVTSVY